MDDGFILLDPREAQFFMKSLPAGARRRGQYFFQNGAVQELKAEEPGMAYSAQVVDRKLCHVRVFFDPDDGWDGECSCDLKGKCEHVFATMTALMAEHRTAAVRSLSSSSPGAAAAVSATRLRPEVESGSELSRRLTIALGRNLNREEAQFVRGVHSVYTRCNESRRITNWDFEEMGLHLSGNGWDSLRIWPAFPASEHEFWLYVAQTALDQKARIPEFMMPVTDLAPIQQRLRRWRRSEEIENWNQKLNVISLESHSVHVAQGETDLRLVIGDDELRLQCRRPGQPEFDYLRLSHFRQFGDDCDCGRLQLTAEAEWFWQFFSHIYLDGIRPRYSVLDSQTVRLLTRLLRNPQLEARIVDSQGQPLARPAEPLRWNLEQTGNDQDDYRLRLVQTDGTPAPRILCILPGKPPLYLTEKAIFTGPNHYQRILDPAEEHCIPAPVLEKPSGVRFLQSLGVPLPPRIRDRLEVLPLQIAIDCRLKRFESSNTEECVVSVLAEAADGHLQTWTGYNWLHSRKGSRGGASPGSIILYDSAAVAAVPALLEPLGLRQFNSNLTLRVTKKFPELFTTWLKTVPPEVQLSLDSELASLTSADVSGRVKLDVTETAIDWFDLRVVLDVSDTTLSPEEIKLLLNAKGNYVRLQGKGWRRLQYDLSEDEDERLARLGLSPRELTAEPQRLHALQLADESARRFIPAHQVEQIQRRAGEIQTRVAPPLPDGVTAQMRPYQLEGFHFLAYLSANRFGGILADDMGLGKTLQTLAWLLWLRRLPAVQVPTGNGNNSPSPPVLVVCPKSVMDNWQAEAARFTPELRVRIWTAHELSGLAEGLDTADLHVINYNQLRLLGEGVTPVRWLAVILDEGQYIKNPGSQTAQVARSLRAEHRLVLSGTPIENRLLDLWSLMSFSMPGVLGSRAQFARLHDAKGDPFARRRLAARVRPFVLRRTKRQVAGDLPDRIEEDLFCEIEGEQQTLYRAELKRAQQLLLKIRTQKELAAQQFHFLTSLLRLRQICCDPRLLKPDSAEPGAKIEALLELLEPLMEEGEKVLVFSQFVQVLDLLRPLLAERGWRLFYLTGATENRGDLIREFQTAEGAAVFLISLKAGGFGLNLTAASYVVLFDPWWNPAVENQAIDRTHRIGQTNKVIAYRLLIKKSIEEKIRDLQKQKKALAEDVLGEEQFAQSLTLADLRFLFAD